MAGKFQHFRQFSVWKSCKNDVFECLGHPTTSIFFACGAKMLKFFSNAEIELIPDNILFKNEFGGAVARMKID